MSDERWCQTLSKGGPQELQENHKIKHRLFSFITQNWRGKPLITHQVIVNLISATTTKTGLKVRAEIDQNIYPTGRKITDAEMAQLNITYDEFHGEWNYAIQPRT